MTVLAYAAMASASFGLTWWLTDRVRRYAIARQLLDIPNARSSHVVATPRGGGIAVALTSLTGVIAAGLLGVVHGGTVAGLVGSGALVSAVGFVDDYRQLRRRWRLLAHVLAAVWLLFWTGGLPPLRVLAAPIDLGLAGHALAVLYVVWLINLTNFMDGIDGLTGVEVVTACLGGVALYFVATATATAGVVIVPLVLMAATLGFLLWNWPPAKIFLGDAGSGFLGLMLAALALDSARVAPQLFWSWNILLGVFVVDATITVARRALRGERFYEPHRTHGYQHAAQRCRAHQPVTLAVAAVNVGWLLPVALLVAQQLVDGAVGAAVAYAPLAGLALWLGAGISSRAIPGDNHAPV